MSLSDKNITRAPRLRVISLPINERAASLKGKWQPAPDVWTEASRNRLLRPAQLNAAITPHGRMVTRHSISFGSIGSTMHYARVVMVGMVCNWSRGLACNLLSLWMRLFWPSVPGFRPRPSVQKALVFILARSGSLVYLLQKNLAPVRSRWLQSFWALCHTLSVALVHFGQHSGVVSSGFSLSVISIDISSPGRLLCGERLLCTPGSTIPECRENECGNLADGEAQEVALVDELLLRGPQPHSVLLPKKLTLQVLGGAAAEDEGGVAQRCARSALTLPRGSGSPVFWITPPFMLLFGSRNASTPTYQQLQRSHDHPRLFKALDCNLRRPRVRLREQRLEQASLHAMNLPTRIRAPLFPTPAEWWRNNRPPPWMSKSSAWLRFQFQNGGSMVFARYLSSYVMSVKCLGTGMNGSSESVMGAGSIAQCLLRVLSLDRWEVPCRFGRDRKQSACN